MLDDPTITPLKPETAMEHRLIDLMTNFHQTRTLPAMRSLEQTVDTRMREQRQVFEGLIKSTDVHLRETERTAQDATREATQEMRAAARQFGEFVEKAQEAFGTLKASDQRHDQLIGLHDNRIGSLEAKAISLQREVDLLTLSNAGLIRDIRGDQANPSPIQMMTDKLDRLTQQFNDYTSQQKIDNQSLQSHETRISQAEEYINSRRNIEQLLFTGGALFWKNRWFFITLLMVLAAILAMVLQLQR